MRWSDVNFERQTATIARSLTERMEFKPPKNDRIRTLNLDDTLLETLRSQ